MTFLNTNGKSAMENFTQSFSHWSGYSMKSQNGKETNLYSSKILIKDKLFVEEMTLICAKFTLKSDLIWGDKYK